MEGETRRSIARHQDVVDGWLFVVEHFFFFFFFNTKNFGPLGKLSVEELRPDFSRDSLQGGQVSVEREVTGLGGVVLLK